MCRHPRPSSPILAARGCQRPILPTASTGLLGQTKICYRHLLYAHHNILLLLFHTVVPSAVEAAAMTKATFVGDIHVGYVLSRHTCSRHTKYAPPTATLVVLSRSTSSRSSNSSSSNASSSSSIITSRTRTGSSTSSRTGSGTSSRTGSQKKDR